MAVLPKLVVRDGTNSTSTSMSITPTMTNLLIVLVVLLFVGLALILCLFIVRNRRKAKQIQKIADLPIPSQSSKISNHRRLTVTAAPYGRNSKPIALYTEKEIMVEESSRPSSTSSPLPEIRITFPEEEDEVGKRKSGRVVVVRVGENGGVGLEPVNDDHLPPYQKSDAERFESLDLDRIGGLQEKF